MSAVPRQGQGSAGKDALLEGRRSGCASRGVREGTATKAEAVGSLLRPPGNIFGGYPCPAWVHSRGVSLQGGEDPRRENQPNLAVGALVRCNDGLC